MKRTSLPLHIGAALIWTLMSACTSDTASQSTSGSSADAAKSRPAPVANDDPSVCIVTPPKSFETVNTKTVGAQLSLFGSKGLSAGTSAEFNAKADEVFQTVPDAAVACAMLLQTVACLANSPGNGASVSQLLTIVYNKNSCSTPSQVSAAAGQIVYIQTSSPSQTPIAKVLLDKLGQAGFLAYGPDIQKHGESPTDPQIRLFYQQDFEAAKLIRSVMVQAGISDVLIKPQYNWKVSPVKPGKLEIWMQEVNQQASQ